MKAVCIENKINNRTMPNSWETMKCSLMIDSFDELSVNESYTIDAVEQRSDGLWFYVRAIGENTFPSPYPAELFEISDSSIPVSWVIALQSDDEGIRLRLSFPEWANDDDFYEKLINEDELAMQMLRDSHE